MINDFFPGGVRGGVSGHYISFNSWSCFHLLEFGVRDVAFLVVLHVVCRPHLSPCYQAFRTAMILLFMKLMGLTQNELTALEEFP